MSHEQSGQSVCPGVSLVTGGRELRGRRQSAPWGVQVGAHPFHSCGHMI